MISPRKRLYQQRKRLTERPGKRRLPLHSDDAFDEVRRYGDEAEFPFSLADIFGVGALAISMGYTYGMPAAAVLGAIIMMVIGRALHAEFVAVVARRKQRAAAGDVSVLIRVIAEEILAAVVGGPVNLSPAKAGAVPLTARTLCSIKSAIGLALRRLWG